MVDSEEEAALSDAAPHVRPGEERSGSKEDGRGSGRAREVEVPAGRVGAGGLGRAARTWRLPEARGRPGRDGGPQTEGAL